MSFCLVAKFIGDLEVVDSIDRPIRIYCDNSAVVSFNNLKRSQGARYIDMKFYKVKEKIAECLITIEHTPAHNMVANQLAKALPVIFKEYVSCIRLWSS